MLVLAGYAVASFHCQTSKSNACQLRFQKVLLTVVHLFKDTLFFPNQTFLFHVWGWGGVLMSIQVRDLKSVPFYNVDLIDQEIQPLFLVLLPSAMHL